MKRVFLIIECVLTVFAVSAQGVLAESVQEAQHQQSRQGERGRELTILFAGDAMQHIPQVRAAYNPANGRYDYHDCFRYVMPYLEQSRLCVVNFETTLDSLPYTGFPRFSAPDDWFYALREAGFCYFALANNHVFDKGGSGLKRTLSVMTEEQQKSRDAVSVSASRVFSMGAYTDSIDRRNRYPLLIEAGGLRVALLNYTYGTNGIRVTPPFLVNMLDTALILSDLLSLERQSVDVKVVVVHWGNEYQTHANRWQREMAQWLVRHGVDAVIGAHPHVVQDGEWIGSVPVVYSLGNLLSNQRKKGTYGGVLAQLVIDTKTRAVSDLRFVPFYVYRGTIRGRYQYYLIPTADYLDGRLSVSLPAYAEHELKEMHQSVVSLMPDFTLFRLKHIVPADNIDNDASDAFPLVAPAPLPTNIRIEF